MHLTYVALTDWPPLAWVAQAQGHGVTVYHGADVETTPAWFAEAVWAGPFEEGGLDRTDIIAGTGARLRDGRVIFISSGSTVERLHSCVRRGSCWVSNSLSGLLAMVGGTLEPSYPFYSRNLLRLVRGAGPYQGTLRSTVGPITLTYFDNLLWDGQRLVRQVKVDTAPVWTVFAEYREWLLSQLSMLADNMISPSRQQQRYRFIATISSGYDSPAVTVLVREAGCAETITLDRGLDGEEDSGAAIAARLGLRCLVLPREAWRACPSAEVPWLAGSPTGQEVMLAPAAPWLRGRVLCTGVHGDRVWSLDMTDLDHPLSRPDHSGLALSEYRLSVGCLHCPLPFWGVRQLAALRAISHSPEMQPWDVGGDYSRPIPRRIVEEAGVPRELFATRKRMAHVSLQGRNDLTAYTEQAYMQWLRAHRGAWLRQGRMPPMPPMWKFHRWCMDHTNWPLPGWWRVRAWNPRRYLFAWAVEERMKAYAVPKGVEL